VPVQLGYDRTLPLRSAVTLVLDDAVAHLAAAGKPRDTHVILTT
jgi:hypothetical protein